ncbi:MAG: hypothetical protein QMC36_08050, partial [Patescibacteria group bacterium]
TIVTEERNDAVLVPTSAITQANGKKTVRVWENGRPKPVEVKTGLTEGSNTEIVSGVTVGQKVVNSAFSITTKSSSSGFSLFGNRSRSSSSGSSTRPSTSGGDAGGPPPGM